VLVFKALFVGQVAAGYLTLWTDLRPTSRSFVT